MGGNPATLVGVTEDGARAVYECDGYTLERSVPDLVVLPGTVDEVAAVVAEVGVEGAGATRPACADPSGREGSPPVPLHSIVSLGRNPAGRRLRVGEEHAASEALAS